MFAAFLEFVFRTFLGFIASLTDALTLAVHYILVSNSAVAQRSNTRNPGSTFRDHLVGAPSLGIGLAVDSASEEGVYTLP